MRKYSDLVRLACDNPDGCGWYDAAADELQHVCDREEWPIERAAAILAITSPRVAVRRNVRLALTYLKHGTLLANGMSTIVASLRHWEATGKINGPKVSAFRDAILGDDYAVVLDVHMANVLHVPQKAFGSVRVREECVTLVRHVADRCGFSPRDTQACLWYAQKRSVGENPEGFPILQEHANWLAHDKRFPNDGPIRQRADRSGNYQRSLFA
jgi:hypothetical protein